MARTRFSSCTRFLAGLATLGLAVAVAVAGSAQASPRAGPDTAPPVRVIVGLDEEVRSEPLLDARERADQRSRLADARAELARDHPVEVVRGYETLPYLVVELPTPELERLARDERVVSVSPDIATTTVLDETIPHIGADVAAQLGFGGHGATIAILDTGVDAGHPFLGGRVVAEACFSLSGDCPSGTSAQLGSGSAVPCAHSVDCGHGTLVAGIAAGESGPDGRRGVAPGAELISINVFSDNPVSPRATSYASDQIAALEHVLGLSETHEIAAVNMSLGAFAFGEFCDRLVPAQTAAIENLRTAGIPTVIASGNDGIAGSLAYPACISASVSVGASSLSDTVSAFTNRSLALDLLAPGGDADEHVLTSSVGGGFDAVKGTSMAAPHAAGAFALLRPAAPVDTVGRLLRVLQATGVVVGDPTVGGHHHRIRVDAAAGWLPELPPPAGFQDLPLTHPFHHEIAWAAAAGITTGYPDGTYRPSAPVTRQALAAFLHRLAGSPPAPGGPVFSDVAASHPFHTAIAWAAAAGITTGYPDGTFRPSAPVTRQALAAFLHRLAAPELRPLPDPGFSDVPTSHPFHTAIAWAAAVEITRGYPDGTFRSTSSTTRQATATFLYRTEPWLIAATG